MNPDDLSDEQVWYALVCTPIIDEKGVSVVRPETIYDTVGRCRALEWAEKYGWKIAMTEWNWNGWGGSRPVGRSLVTRGIGAAGFLNAALRSSDLIELATQSMLVGKGWPFSALHVTPEPHLHPSGQATALYSTYHGDRRVGCEVAGVPTREQPLAWGEINAAARLALVDIVTTASDSALFVHAINRDFARAHTLEIRAEGVTGAHKTVRHTLQGDMDVLVGEGCRAAAEVTHAESVGTPLRVELPPRSLSVVEVPMTCTAD